MANEPATITLLALAVLVVVTHGVIRYENLPPDSEAARTCCAGGAHGDGSCIKSGEIVRAYPEGSVTYAE